MKAKHGDRSETVTTDKLDKDITGGTTETKEMKTDHDMGNMCHHKNGEERRPSSATRTAT